jgi:alkylation response protein AidB-like acyl-CoA dehydrogenase
MEFTFSDDQDALRDAVRDFLTKESPSSYVRSMMDDERGFSDEVWDQVVELGWTGLLVPDDLGGLGLGMVDLAVVLEEMGRVPFPGPFLSSAVFATLAARRLGLEDRLTSLASGATRGTIAVDELGHGDPVDRIRTRARRKGGEWRLTGLKPVVLDGHTADWVLVPARTQEGLSSFMIEAPQGERVPTWDHTRKVARLDLDATVGERVGPDGDHTAVWRRIVDDATVAVCCELLGVMEQAHHLAVEYAKTRVQFDRPIATFQVIKHKAVDMLHAIELTRVGTHYAAWASDVDTASSPPEDSAVRQQAVAMAKGFAAEAANSVCAESIQIHGGVGFTWDCDAHLFYRRAKELDLLLGSGGWQRQRLADQVLATT